MSPLVRLTNAGAQMSGVPVLQGLNWALRRGEVWAVAGPNGAGKSSFFRLVRGDLWPCAGERTYALEGRETRSPLSAKKRIALVSPELGDAYLRADWALTVEQVVQSGLGGGTLPPYPLLPQHQVQARALLERLGLSHWADQDLRALSTGQRRQVLLARSLVGGPRVLILDEFFEGLDAAARGRLRGLVEELVRGGLTLLYSTHRPAEVLGGTTHRLKLAGGHIAAQGEVGSAPEQAAPRIPAPATSAGEVVLSVENADVYRAERRVLENVSWRLRAGEHWAVLGPNGAGKSSFARLVAGELHPAVGARIRRFDLPSRASLEARRRVIALVSAEEQARHRRGVLGETVVASGLFGTVGAAPPPTAAQRRGLERLAGRLDINDLLARPANELSHGQLKKLLLARALLSRPRLLLLDEPFDYLDAGFQELLLKELERAVAGGAQTLFVAHHPEDLPAFLTHVLRLEAGRVVSAGPL